MARNLRSAAPTANPSRAGSPPYRRVGSRRERGGAQVAQEPRHPGRLALRHARASVARRAALRRARRTASRPWTRERAAFRWWGAGHQDAEGATRSEDGYYCRPPPRDHSGDLVIGPTTIHCRLIPRAENGAREVAEACTQVLTGAVNPWRAPAHESMLRPAQAMQVSNVKAAGGTGPTSSASTSESTNKNRNYAVLAGTIVGLSAMGWYLLSKEPKKTEEVVN